MDAPAGVGQPMEVPLAEELTPLPDGWDVLRRFAGLPYPLFFDSAARTDRQGRYSFVTADPFEMIRLAVGSSARPLDVLAGRLACFRATSRRHLPPFQGGAAGLFGYGLGRSVERLPAPRADEFGLPDLAVGLYDWVVAIDHQQRRAWVMSTGFPETDPDRRVNRAAERLRQVRRWLDSAPGPAPWNPGLPVTPVRQFAVEGAAGLTSNFDRAGYLAAVRRGIEYVHAGDCFQVNISQRLLVPATLPPLELYRRLRERNPTAFSGYLDLGDAQLLSASPERFMTLAGGEIETRPIKGTRPRGSTPEDERLLIAELLSSPKDRAENVMIVDLLRNDLGRVCRYGSIRVPVVCGLESTRFVHHLVSELRGRLRDGLGPVDLLRASFPGGSVTGAPKIRAMEIIAELEPTARGAYCGSLGYVGFDGTMDTSILIRTFTASRGWFQFPVGGGIVADSVPEREYAETWHKAEGLLRALR